MHTSKNEKKMLGPFRPLSGDVNWVDYGGTFYRKVEDGVYHVLAFDSWENMDSSAVEYGRYNVQLAVVDLREAQNEREPSPNALPGSMGELCTELERAMRSYDWRWERGCIVSEQGDIVAQAGTEALSLALVEACFRYGLKEVLLDESGNSKNALIRSAVKESR